MSQPDPKAERADYMLEFVKHNTKTQWPNQYDPEEFEGLTYAQLEERYYALRGYLEDKYQGEGE